MNLADYLDTTKTSQAAFAKQLGVSQGLVHQWLAGKRPISAEQCPVIERITNGAVTCEELNDKVDWAFVRGAAVRIDPEKIKSTDDVQPPTGRSLRRKAA